MKIGIVVDGEQVLRLPFYNLTEVAPRADDNVSLQRQLLKQSPIARVGNGVRHSQFAPGGRYGDTSVKAGDEVAIDEGAGSVVRKAAFQVEAS